MKKFFKKIGALIISCLMLFSCISCQNSSVDKMNQIPTQNISYIYFRKGNVIDEGKQAVFLYFVSDYAVIKMEIEGALLDKDGHTIYVFETKMSFGDSTNKPEIPIRVEATLVKNIASVSFTTIKAYTMESLTLSN